MTLTTPDSFAISISNYTYPTPAPRKSFRPILRIRITFSRNYKTVLKMGIVESKRVFLLFP
jgi:hypothetical protein